MTQIEAPIKTFVPKVTKNGKLHERAIILASQSLNMLQLRPSFQTNGNIQFTKSYEPTPLELVEISGEASSSLNEWPVETINSLLAAADSADYLQMYLLEIGRIPLLPADREKQLAFQYRDGVEAENRLLGEPLLPEKEKMELYETRAFGQVAKNRMIEANLRMVVSVAVKFLGRGLSLEDMIQEGNIGLQNGVERFDPNRDCKLSTYTYWWIRQGITRAIANQGKTIRIPTHLQAEIGRYLNAIPKLYQEMGREPSPEEIAVSIGLKATRGAEIERVLKLTPISLDEPMLEDDSDSDRLASFIPSNTFLSPVEEAENSNLEQITDEYLEELGTDLGLVLRLRFGIPYKDTRNDLLIQWGLDVTKPHSLYEIGTFLGKSPEIVRQIETEVKQKLRHKGKLREKIKEFLG